MKGPGFTQGVRSSSLSIIENTPGPGTYQDAQIYKHKAKKRGAAVIGTASRLVGG